jgi:hypothetical protein
MQVVKMPGGDELHKLTRWTDEHWRYGVLCDEEIHDMHGLDSRGEQIVALEPRTLVTGEVTCERCLAAMKR